MSRVALVWCAAFLVLATFATFRIAIPWLVNLHSTAALLAALLAAGAMLTADFLIGNELVSLWRDLKENDHEDDQ